MCDLLLVPLCRRDSLVLFSSLTLSGTSLSKKPIKELWGGGGGQGEKTRMWLGPRGWLRGPILGKAEASLERMRLLPTPLAWPGRVLRNGGNEVPTTHLRSHLCPVLTSRQVTHFLSPLSQHFSEKEFMKLDSDGLNVCLRVKAFLFFCFQGHLFT